MKLTKYKLGKLVEISRGASLSGEYYATEGELIRLTLGHFDYQNGGFKDNTSKDNLYFIGTVKSEFIMSEGDIITPLTEQTPGLLGSTARIPQSGIYIQSQDVALVRPNHLLDSDFCYYLLPSALVKKQLAAGAQQTKIRHTTPDRIKDLTVFIPELEEQKRIGHLLSLIDRKIALNREINRNLEAMARQLYDYWFVQFDFPNADGKPYKSSGGKMVWNDRLKREIPENWEVRLLETLIFTNRGISYNTASISGDGIPMLNLATFNVDGTFKEKGLKTYSGNYSKDKVLQPMDLVMCNTQQTAIDFDKDIIGKAFLVPFYFDGDVVSSHHVTTIETTNKNLKPYLCYLSRTDHFHRYAAGCTTGTNITGLNFTGLGKYLMELPPEIILKKFADFIENIERRKSIIMLEVSNLLTQRDELLPLLMNGQVSVMPSAVNCDLSHD